MSNIVRREQTRALTVPPNPNDIWYLERGQNKEADLGAYFRTLWKRKWLVLLVILTVVGAAAYQTYTATPLYRSTVKIHIGPEANVLPYQQLYPTTSSHAPNKIATQTQILSSLTLSQRVAKQLDIVTEPSQLLERSKWLLSNLNVQPVVTTEVVNVSYSSEDPEFAAEVVNTWADAYINHNFESRYESINSMKNFLHDELSALKNKLERSEAELITYAHDKKVSEQGNTTLTKLDGLDEEMKKAEFNMLANRYRDIRNATPETFPESLKTASMKRLESHLSTLQQTQVSLSTRFLQAHPEIKKVQKEITDTKQNLVNETQKIIEQTRIEYDLARRHYRRLKSAHEKQRQAASQLSEDSIRYNILKREVEIDQQLYKGLLERLRQAGVSADMKSANIRVIDRGVVPTKPYSPNEFMNLSIGLATGLLLGVMLAFVSEYADKTLRTPEQVEDILGLPAPVVIPSLGRSWRRASARLLTQRRRKTHAQRLDLYLNSISSEARQSYRWLRTSLLLSADTSPQTILVTSSLPGEGKTSTCLNLGISFAQTGAQTLILELDLYKPDLANRFNLDPNLCINRYLLGNGELMDQISETGIPNLAVIPSGPAQPNPPELLGSNRLESALETLSHHFQYVIIDSSPLLSVSDATVIATHVDGVLLLVRAGKTPQDALHKSKQLLMSVGARISGLVVNDLELQKMQYGYGYPQTYPS